MIETHKYSRETPQGYRFFYFFEFIEPTKRNTTILFTMSQEYKGTTLNAAQSEPLMFEGYEKARQYITSAMAEVGATRDWSDNV